MRHEENRTEAAFDLTLAGFASGPSLLKLMWEPPFLGLTLCLFTAALLAGLAGWARFGPPAVKGGALPPGLTALADTTAALLRLARRTHVTGAAYAELVREATARAIGLPPGAGHATG